jgi:hypothetical protein
LTVAAPNRKLGCVDNSAHGWLAALTVEDHGHLIRARLTKPRVSTLAWYVRRRTKLSDEHLAFEEAMKPGRATLVRTLGDHRTPPTLMLIEIA